MPSRTPFPGMDPYLEHPLLWQGLQLALAIEIGKQLAPMLFLRYAVSLETREYMEIAGKLYPPDVLTVEDPASIDERTQSDADVGFSMPISRNPIEVRERYLDLLDLRKEQKAATRIELVSPANRRDGLARESYQRQQHDTLHSEINLVEIDLLRIGSRVVAFPEYRLPQESQRAEYLVAVHRGNDRHQVEVYPCRLRERLPTFRVPLSPPDADVVVDLQSALEEVYDHASYMLRVKYHEPCIPPLPADDQAWATACWNECKAAHPEWFPARREPAPTPSEGNGSAGST